MPEKMKICPNCNNELGSDDWEFYERVDETWFSVVDEFVCDCPHCKKKLRVKLQYELLEESVDIKY